MRPVPDDLAARVARGATVLADRGYDDTTMEDLAEATGVPRATLYYYFNGKQDLLDFLLARSLARYAAVATLAVDETGTPTERLRSMICRVVEEMTTDRGPALVLMANLGRLGRLPDLANAVVDAFYAPMISIIEDGLEDRSLGVPGQVETAAAAIFGSVLIGTLHHLVRGDAPDDVGRRIADQVVDGIRVRPAP